ncbi:hypothetical protein PIB30_099003, partial [Stylosanthes scabra]|nr:hypothetical protein [Stylosanthes scabra]
MVMGSLALGKVHGVCDGDNFAGLGSSRTKRGSSGGLDNGLAVERVVIGVRIRGFVCGDRSRWRRQRMAR